MTADIVALVAEGEIRNITEVHLGTGFKNKAGVRTTYRYPLGQHFRGFFGYEVLYCDAEISTSWIMDAIALVYFKDGLVKHDCGGFLYPIVNGNFQNYRCSNCGQVLKYPTKTGTVLFTRIDRMTGKAHAYRMECITRGYTFRFKAILNMKRGSEYADEFVAMIKLAEEEGIRLGAKVGKGKGLFKIENVKITKITTKDIKERSQTLKKKAENGGLTFHFISDVVSETTGEVILRGIKNAGKFFYPDYEPYEDPFIRVAWKEQLPLRTVKFMHKKVNERWIGKNKITKETVVPAGAKIRIEIANASDMFFDCLAVAELVMGIGKYTSAGKGEFVVL